MENASTAGPADAAELPVSVVYALPEEQVIVELRVRTGTVVGDAIARSGLLQRFAELAQRPLTCAVFGRIVPPSALLRSGDRIEILRPLLIDPKQSRRQAAERARKKI